MPRSLLEPMRFPEENLGTGRPCCDLLDDNEDDEEDDLGLILAVLRLEEDLLRKEKNLLLGVVDWLVVFSRSKASLVLTVISILLENIVA